MSIFYGKCCKLKYKIAILVIKKTKLRQEISMKNCKWLIYLLFILLYAFIVFRYIQKRPSSEAKKMIPKEIEVIKKEIEVTEPEITSTQK